MEIDQETSPEHHLKSVLPTKFKNFPLDQQQNSAAGEKVWPLHRLTMANFAVFSMVYDPKWQEKI
jgi:hypothetical protein